MKPIQNPDIFQCRICLQDNSQYQLISACNCTGSVKYAHQQCLKAWIISKFPQIDKATCQLCQTTYQMTYKIKHRCIFCSLMSKCSAKCLIGPLLMCLQVMVGLMVYILIQKYTQASSQRAQAFAVVLIFVCIIAGIVILALAFATFRQICFEKSLANWKIVQQTKKQENEKTFVVLPMLQVFQENLVFPDRTIVNGEVVISPRVNPAGMNFVRSENSSFGMFQRRESEEEKELSER